MGANVLAFLPRRDPSRWQIDEIAECYRVIDILGSVGMSVTLEADVSDEGDPWLVFVREDSQDVIIHITRINGQVIAASAASESLFRGRSMRDVLQLILQTQPFVLPASRPLGADDRLLMHPATMLVAVVATAFLASQESAELAGYDEAAFIIADRATGAEPTGAGRKQPLHLDTGHPGRAAPASDTHAPFMTTVASAVLASVAVIAGEQILRPAELFQEETLTFSFSEMMNEAKHPAAHLLTSVTIGIDPDLDPLLRQMAHSVLDSDGARAAAFESVNEHNASSSAPALPGSFTLGNATNNFSAQAGLQASSIQINTQNMAAPLTPAVQIIPSVPKASFSLDASMMGGAEFSLEAYSPNISFRMGIAAKAAVFSAPTPILSLQVAGFPEGGSFQQASSRAVSGTSQNAVGVSTSGSSASGLLQQEASFFTPGNAPPLAPVQAASGFSQTAASVPSPISITIASTDFVASPIEAKLAIAKMSLSVSDLFWHSAAVMRAMGIDFYSATRSSGATVEIVDAKPLLNKPTTNELLDPKSLLDGLGLAISDSLNKTTVGSPLTSATATSETSMLNGTKTPDAVSPTTKPTSEGLALSGNLALESVTTVSKQPNEATIQTASLSTSLPVGDAAATKLLPAPPASAGQEPAMFRSAAEVVQAVQSMVSFVYDPRHEIVLKGQDLEILRMLVKANPLIAGADRVLLSHGQILAGDGVMLMPGVALLPAEVFVPKLVAGLPTVQEGALEIFFRNDLTVTLAGVIDI
jgi:hypothetical protein